MSIIPTDMLNRKYQDQMLNVAGRQMEESRFFYEQRYVGCSRMIYVNTSGGNI